jgi:DDE superfamily endonuclease
MNLQVIASPHGDLLWLSGLLPGAVHDLTAARIRGIVQELAASGLVVLADKGYTGVGDHVRTPYRGRNKPATQKAANRAHAQLHAPGERANGVGLKDLMARMGHNSERAAMIYQHQARGADAAITNAIDVHIDAEQSTDEDGDDGPARVLVPAG